MRRDRSDRARFGIAVDIVGNRGVGAAEAYETVNIRQIRVDAVGHQTERGLGRADQTGLQIILEYGITHENDRRADDDQDRDRDDDYSVFALGRMLIVFHAIILHQRRRDNKETKKKTCYIRKVHPIPRGDIKESADKYKLFHSCENGKTIKS